MRIRVDGRDAPIQAGGGARLGQIVATVRHWAEATGKRVESVRLDGRRIREEDLPREVSGGDGGGIVEIRTSDPEALVIAVLRRAADLTPGAQLDLGFAGRSLLDGEAEAGLEALYQAIHALGSIEAALRLVEPRGEAARREGEENSPLAGLRDLLRRMRDALAEQDLAGVSSIIREEGLAAVAAAYQRILSEIDVRVAFRTIRPARLSDLPIE